MSSPKPIVPADRDTDVAVRVAGLTKDFRQGGVFGRSLLRAVNRVDLEIGKSEIVALVGESGSGKSTIARILAKIEPATAGEAWVDGVDILRMRDRRSLAAYRGQLQMVFQDPFGSINPVHPVGYTLGRAVRLHEHVTGAADLRERMAALLHEVDLSGDLLGQYPHQLSGGQRQRVAIARALAARPSIILADEPTSMLDVSIRIGILNLMSRLRAEEGIGMLFITHDLASARYLADRTLVMFAGELVEGGDSLELMDEPAHPYTRLLMSAIPNPRRTDAVDLDAQRRLRELVTNGTDCPYGDAAHPCSADEPVHHPIGERHWVRCLRYRPQGRVEQTALSEVRLDAEEAL
jgi:peptide/nickel transport system ATP-binding protein